MDFRVLQGILGYIITLGEGNSLNTSVRAGHPKAQHHSTENRCSQDLEMLPGSRAASEGEIQKEVSHGAHTSISVANSVQPKPAGNRLRHSEDK